MYSRCRFLFSFVFWARVFLFYVILDKMHVIRSIVRNDAQLSPICSLTSALSGLDRTCVLAIGMLSISTLKHIPNCKLNMPLCSRRAF